MKRYQKMGIAFALTVSVLSAFLLPVKADNVYSKEEMEKTLTIFAAQNAEYAKRGIENFSEEVWAKHGLLVTKENVQKPRFSCFDITEGFKKTITDNKKVNGQWKYLGTTPEGYLVENPDYPADAYNGKPFSQFNWIKNQNEKTSLWQKIELLTKDERKRQHYYYINLIKDSFEAEFGKGFDRENITKEMEEAMLKAAILVYPMAEGRRTLISFRNLGDDGKIYEVTASMPKDWLRTSKTPIEITAEELVQPLIPQAADFQGGILRLASEKPGQEIFDVAKGIPATEKLYANVIIDQYKGLYLPEKRVHIEWEKKYEPDPKTGKMKLVGVEKKEYPYMDIAWAYVYEIASAEINSTVLPGGQLTLMPQNYSPVTVSMTSGGYQNGKTTNATLTINGHTITAGESIPASPKISADVLYQDGIVIPTATPNQKDAPTTGRAVYRLAFSYGGDFSATKEESLTGNPVTAHTPVVCYPSLSDRTFGPGEKYPKAKDGQKQYMKEESFAVTYPLSGEHLAIPGYGSRDYSAYTAKRQVRFSFDVYEGTDYTGIYRPAGKWYDFPAGAEKDTASYFIPAWAKEGEKHDISFRSLPVNLRDEASQAFEYLANKDIKNEKAVQDFTVAVFGKVMDSRILQIADGRNYASLEMPVYPQAGKLANRQDGIALGMPVDLMLTTNSDLFYEADSIKVVPHYFFVDKQGKKTEVDLYYHANQKLKQISAVNTEIEQKARLKDFSLWISNKHFDDTAKLLEKQKRKNDMTYQTYLDDLIGSRYVPLGDNSRIVIGERLKLYSGRDLADRIKKPREVKTDDVYLSRQNWYLRFFLPNETYAVAKGTSFQGKTGIRLNEEPFLHDGYLLVQLEWQIYKNGELYFSYLTEPKGTGNLPYQGQYGDSFFYDSERRASQRLN
ncbi:hypothetical protein C3V36_01820 [Lachnospiraceae bacterium oral taxon 500]|nr:hypothetical protein C3V36_01820 [Lachnospiraceae bacterium oral taxon 500]